jgi:uncharacterized protein YukE
MTNLAVTYAEMEDTATALDGGRESLLATLTSMKTAVTRLTQEGFRTDTASGAYERSYQDLSNGIEQAVGALEAMSGYLRGAGQTFEEIDASLAAGI